MNKISIIVPIENNADYLADCIHSLSQQSYQSLEIILVNNGSTDGSLEIMNQAAEQDERIRMVTQPHASLGSVKNLGVAMATGDFICFVHPTDYLGGDNIKNLVKSQEKYQSDIACSTYFRIDNNGTYYFYTNDDDPAQQALVGVFSPQEWIHREVGVSANISDLFMQNFNKIIRRELFQNVVFPATDDCTDNYTIWKLYLLADRISYINAGDYCYRMLPAEKQDAQKKFHISLAMNKSLEERMAIYNLIDFDSSFLNDTYIDSLVQLRDNALAAGNYHYYKDCCFKLDMIKKYSAEQ